MALVPIGVVTVTSTTPAGSGGETAVIEVAEFTVKLAAFTEPNFTDVTSIKLDHVIVTIVPPATGPVLGFTFPTLGGGIGMYWKRSATPSELVPSGVVTVTSTVPVPGG